MKPEAKIFKAYDIRGIWNKEWDVESAYLIGKAIAKLKNPRTVAIGKDMRNSGEDIFEQLKKAFLEEGINVKDLGLCATELTYYATSFREEIDLAIMITASHNPAEYNGMKITDEKGHCIGLEDGLNQIKDLILSANGEMSRVNGRISRGEFSKLDLWSEYQKHIFKLAKVEAQEIKQLKIVIDPANGMGGYTFDRIFHNLNLEVVRIFWDLDGTFPNHPADPFRESNIEILKRKVVEEKADLGIAFDGDADRVFFVDKLGRNFHGYYFAAFLTEYFLKNVVENSKAEAIAYDPRYYWALRKVADQHGTNHLISKAGHTLLKKSLREVQGPIAIETTGHVIFRDFNFNDTTMLTILFVLKMISNGTNLTEALDYYLKNYPISGEYNYKVNNVTEILEKLEQKYSTGEIIKIDGLGIDFSDWRFNVRTSNTQPLMRLNIEAKSKELVAEKLAEIQEIIGVEAVDE